MPGIINKLGWGAAGALAIALLAALGGVIYAGSIDPPAGVTTGTPTQEGLIFQPTDCTGFPIVISTAGSYKLAQNIIMPAACPKNGINITASDVSLDLNGFQVGGVSGSLVGINATGGTGVSISDGRVVNWGQNGVVISSNEGVLENLLVRGNGGGGSFPGIYVSGGSARITNVTAVGNGGGIFLAAAAGHSTVTDSEVAANTGDGIDSVGWDTIVRNNNVHDNTQDGIHSSNGQNIIDGNNVNNNGQSGITGASADTITNNNVAANAGDGIFAPGGSRMRIIGNNVASNAARGIWVGGGSSTIADNTSTSNGTDGYYIVGGGYRVDNNHSSGNNTGFRVANASTTMTVIVRNSAMETCGGGGFALSGLTDVGVIASPTSSTGSPWNNIGYACIP